MTPATEAGKSLMLRLVGYDQTDYHRYGDAIVAIEQEAVAAERTRIRAAVKEEPGFELTPYSIDLYVHLDTILAVIEGTP
jgi:hypothetical protein